MAAASEREVWSFHIRQDSPGPRVEIGAEYVIYPDRGGRVVTQGLHPIRAALTEVEDVPVILPDGHATTMGAVARALLEAAELVTDESEELGNGAAETPPPQPNFHKAMQRRGRRIRNQ